MTKDEMLALAADAYDAVVARLYGGGDDSLSGRLRVAAARWERSIGLDTTDAFVCRIEDAIEEVERVIADMDEAEAEEGHK